MELLCIGSDTLEGGGDYISSIVVTAFVGTDLPIDILHTTHGGQRSPESYFVPSRLD